MSLPFGWSQARVGDILNVRNGFAFKSSDFCAEGVPVVRQGDLQQDFVDTRHASRVPGHFIDDYPHFIIEEGDLLIGMSGALGKIARYRDNFPALQNQRTGLLRFPDYLSPGFVRLALKYVEPQIRAQGKGIAVQNVSATDIEGCSFPCPPLQEQHRIIDEVEKQFTRLDDAIGALKRVQANLKRYRASVLKAACEGRLVPTEAELARKEGRSYEPASELLKRILAERRAKWEADQLQKMIAAGKPPKNDEWKRKYVEPTGLPQSALPLLPEGWTWVRAEQVCDFITKGTTPAAYKLYEGIGEVPYIKVYNLTDDGRLDFSNKPTFIDRSTHDGELARSRVYPSDVLMNIVGPPLGKVSIVPDTYPEWNINQAIAIFRPYPGLSVQFLCHMLLTETILGWAIRRAKATAGQFNLTLELCRDLPIPLAPEDEQRRINEELARRLSGIEAVNAVAKTNSQRAHSLRQSVLSTAFSGQLIPQDPNDEPASVLLERIRAERAALATNNGNQKATLQAGTANGQRRRRITRLAHRVSGGKGVGK